MQPDWRVLFRPWDLFTDVFQNFRTKPVSDLVLNTSVHFEIFSSYFDFVQSTAIISLIVYIWLSCAFPKESPGKYDYDYFIRIMPWFSLLVGINSYVIAIFIVNISSDLDILHVKGSVLIQRKIILIFIQFMMFYVYNKILFCMMCIDQFWF